MTTKNTSKKFSGIMRFFTYICLLQEKELDKIMNVNDNLKQDLVKNYPKFNFVIFINRLKSFRVVVSFYGG